LISWQLNWKYAEIDEVSEILICLRFPLVLLSRSIPCRRNGQLGFMAACCKVVSGTDVVDPFLPIFDLETMMALNGSRPAVLEVEHEYLQPDGAKIEESDSFSVQILSRNKVIFSPLLPAVQHVQVRQTKPLNN